MQMTRDQLEFAISQYLDGTLPPLEAAALEERLAKNADARELLASYQRLNALMKTSLSVPQIDFEAFSTQLSDRLADVEAPVKHYRLSAGRIGWMSAIAASVIIVASVTAVLKSNLTTPSISAGRRQLLVIGPQAEPSTQPAVAQVQIGAPPGMADADSGWQSYEALINRPSRVIIGAIERPAQDDTY